MEIERKWHMPQEPALPALTHTRMLQSYLSLTPEVRIRKYEDLLQASPDRYDLTIKSEGTLAREEIIKELTAEEYRVLRDMTGSAAPIVKDHKTFAWQGYTLEYSVVDPDLPGGFSFAEVEFPSVEEAKRFQAPDWFGVETTEQSLFRMRHYWQATRLTDGASQATDGSSVLRRENS